MKNIITLVALFMSAFVIGGVLMVGTQFSNNRNSNATGPDVSVIAPIIAQEFSNDDSNPVETTNKLVKRAEAAKVLTKPPVESTVQRVQAVSPATKVSEPKQVIQRNPDRDNDHPVWLNIPVAKVNARIIDVGVTATNNLDVPPNYVEVGWYKYGTVPGELGSAVLDGHVDNGGAIDGVFKHLKNLKKGDEIFVTTEDGSKKKFIVTESNVYRTEDFPSDLVFNDKSGALLKIITCHGTFVPSLDTYDHRLIVTAVLSN